MEIGKLEKPHPGIFQFPTMTAVALHLHIHLVQERGPVSMIDMWSSLIVNGVTNSTLSLVSISVVISE